MQLVCGCRIAVRIVQAEMNMVWEKVESLCDNFKPKEGEGSEAAEFNASEGWSDNFRERLGLKNVRIIGGAASDD